MCEANAYMLEDGEEKLLLRALDILEPEEDGSFRLINIFGEQRIINARIKSMNLINHRVVFEEKSGES